MSPDQPRSRPLDEDLFPEAGREPRRSGARLGSETPPRPARPEERFAWRERRPDLRGVVAVAGSSSNAGKTLLAESLIRSARSMGFEVAALKVTRTHLDRCPRENESCGTCDSLVRPFEVITAPERLNQPRKDTARYAAAGADQVVWLLVHPESIGDGIRAALDVLRPGVFLVAEGNSFADHVLSDHILMALSDRHDFKASAQPLLGRIDAYFAPEGKEEAFRLLLARLGDGRAKILPFAAAKSWLGSTAEKKLGGL